MGMRRDRKKEKEERKKERKKERERKRRKKEEERVSMVSAPWTGLCDLLPFNTSALQKISEREKLRTQRRLKGKD